MSAKPSRATLCQGVCSLVLGAFPATGTGQITGLTYNHSLASTVGYRSYVGIRLDDKLIDAADTNAVAVQWSRRRRPLTLGYAARVETATSVWGYNADVAFNLGGGEDNTLAAYQSEDARITTSSWRALRGSGNYLTSFGSGWLWSVRGQFQYSLNTARTR